jgi:hypothetical protein
MDLTIHDRIRRGALNGAMAELNVGTTDATGDCRLLTAADAELAQVLFGNPAFAAATSPGGSVAEAHTNTMQADTTVTPGTIGKIQWRDRDNVVLVAGTVGLAGSGANMILSDVVIPVDATSVSSPGLSVALVLV